MNETEELRESLESIREKLLDQVASVKLISESIFSIVQGYMDGKEILPGAGVVLEQAAAQIDAESDRVQDILDRFDFEKGKPQLRLQEG
jgi:hypothetical protein